MIMHDQFFSEVMLLESACRSVWEDYFKTLARLMAKTELCTGGTTNTQWELTSEPQFIDSIGFHTLYFGGKKGSVV